MSVDQWLKPLEKIVSKMTIRIDSGSRFPLRVKCSGDRTWRGERATYLPRRIQFFNSAPRPATAGTAGFSTSCRVRADRRLLRDARLRLGLRCGDHRVGCRQPGLPCEV